EERSFLAEAPLSLLRYRDISWLNTLRLAWERAGYGWQRWVLGYRGEQQWRLLRDWLGIVDWRALGLLSLLLLGGVLAVQGLWLVRPWRRAGDALGRSHRRFERLLARHGLRRRPGEGARDFATRAAERLEGQREQILAFARLFEQARYAGRPGLEGALRLSLRRLRQSLARR